MDGVLNLIVGVVILFCCIFFTKRMIDLPSSQRLNLAFFSVCSLIFGFWVILGSKTYASYSVNFQSISYASQECLHAMFKYPIGTVFELFPFALIGAISAEHSKDGKIRQGCCMIFGGIAPVIYWYVMGNIGAQYALQKHAWTAAALSSGLSVIYSIPFALVGLFAGYQLSKLLDKLKI